MQIFADQFSKDSRYRTELYKLRRKFMSHADGLIHADLHTSNIMASRDKMKVIDMEFAFMGPFGYDLGYLVGNLISQYCAACFKRFPSEQNRKQFKAYLLATIQSLIETYMKTFYFMLGKKCEGKIPRTAGAVAEYFTGSHGGYAWICQHGELVPLCK